MKPLVLSAVFLPLLLVPGEAAASLQQVSVRVIDGQGRPVPAGEVRIFRIILDLSPTWLVEGLNNADDYVLEADGTLQVPLDEPGEYTVSINAPGFVPWISDLFLVPGEEVVVQLDRGGRIVGRISGLEGSDMRQVHVEARSRLVYAPDSWQTMFSVGKVDSRGRYEIDSVDARTWTVTASTDQPARRVSREVVVGESGGETRLDLAFPEEELVVHGQILFAGDPAVGAQVAVLPAADSSLPVSTETDAHGVFRIAGLVSGRYELWVQHKPLEGRKPLEFLEEIELLTDREIVLDLQQVEPEME